jgi:competence protein ComEA
MKKAFLAVFLVLLFAAAAFATVNINTASKEELNALSGIGPVKAEAIVKYRQEKGLFKSVDELKNVYGIGDKLFAQIKSEVTVSGPEGAAPDKVEVKSTTATKTEAAAQPKAKAEEKSATPPPAEKKEAASPVAPQKQ